MAILDHVLRPFINPGENAKVQQEKNLRAILFEGAKFGLLLFSQPASWDFDWRASRKAANGGASSNTQARSSIVVSPALVKSASKDGTRAAGKKVVAEAEVLEW
jgi:hypothetical protein